MDVDEPTPTGAGTDNVDGPGQVTTGNERGVGLRENTTPFLIRTFIKIGSFHRLSLFEDGTLPTTDEQQLFAWKDASLRELLTILRSTAPHVAEYKHPLARFSFRAVYVDSANTRDKSGHGGGQGRLTYAQKELGMVYSRDILGEPGTLGSVAPRLLLDDEAAGNGSTATGKEERTLDGMQFVPGDYLLVAVFLPKNVTLAGELGAAGGAGPLAIKGSAGGAGAGGVPAGSWKVAVAAGAGKAGGDGGWGRGGASSGAGAGAPPSSARSAGGGHWRGDSNGGPGAGGPPGGRAGRGRGGGGRDGGFGRDRDRDRDDRVPPPRRPRDESPVRGGWGRGRGGGAGGRGGRGGGAGRDRDRRSRSPRSRSRSPRSRSRTPRSRSRSPRSAVSKSRSRSPPRRRGGGGGRYD